MCLSAGAEVRVSLMETIYLYCSLKSLQKGSWVATIRKCEAHCVLQWELGDSPFKAHVLLGG